MTPAPASPPPSPPPRPTSTSPHSLSAASSPPPSFDPLTAYLDEQWLRLDLSHSSPPSPQPPSPSPPAHILALASAATNLSAAAATWTADFAHADLQLRSALADADRADAFIARSTADLRAARAALAHAHACVARLFRAHHHAQSEIAALQECVATLHAAHQLDARINALVIADQAEEIAQLKDKLRDLQTQRAAVRSALCKASVAVGRRSGLISAKRNMPMSDDPSQSDVDSDGKSPPARFVTPSRGVRPTVSTTALVGKHILQPDMDGSTASDESADKETDIDAIFTHSESHHSIQRETSRMSARNSIRRNELQSLQRTKERLFHAFERRHSTTIHSVVKRTSQLSLDASHTAVTFASEMPQST